MKPQQIVESGYNRIYRKYHAKRTLKSNKRMLVDLVKYLPKNSKVLDAGCGAGYPVAKFLVDKKFDVVGIDISKNMLQLAKRIVPKAKFCKMDMAKMKFPKNSFNAITCFYSIIHVPRKSHPKIIRKFYSILKPKGMLLISVGLTGFESGIEQNWMGAKMFWSQFWKETNLKMIKKAGFRIIWTKPVGSKNDRHLFVLAQKI